MNQKEINELKRRFRPDKTNINHVYGCYVNTSREIVSQLDISLGMLPQEEAEMYLERLRKVLSGVPGRNLIDIVFSNEQVMDSDEHRLLLALRDSRLADPELRQELFQRIIDSLSLEDQNFLILLAFDSYDVPRKGKDGSDAESDQTFSYVVCAVCPVKEGATELRYFHEESAFHISGVGQVAGKTALGFLFPAFDNRCTNIYNALYFAAKPEEQHPELIDGLFRVEAPMSAPQQREAFRDVLSESLEGDYNYDTMQTVHELFRERILQHKEEKDPEPLELSPREIGEVLKSGGVSEEHVTAFREACADRFGGQALLNPGNLIDSARFEIVTPEVKISVQPEFSYLVESRVIDGRKYILIPADQGVELNGAPMNVSGGNGEG